MNVLIEFRPDSPYVRVTSHTSLEELESSLLSQGFYDLDQDELLSILEQPYTWIPLRRASRDATFDLKITDDEMGVLLTITPPYASGRQVTEDDIKQRLDQYGVVHGVDWPTIIQALSQQRADRLLIAAGTSPVPGANGWYDIFVATDSSGPKIREDGRADYRNLGKFVFVQEGAVLGRIHKATPGKPGTTVLGNPVPPSPGKDVDLTKILGDGLGVDVHGGIIALRSGHLHQDPSGKYSIKTSLQIDGDVDFSVGDIRDFPGDIVIKGSVTVGFSVSATGNIFIDGRIEGGTVISRQGDIEQCEVLLKELVARYGSFDKRYKQVLLTKKTSPQKHRITRQFAA